MAKKESGSVLLSVSWATPREMLSAYCACHHGGGAPRPQLCPGSGAKSKNGAFSGDRPALRCKREMQLWRQGGRGEAPHRETGAIQKAAGPYQRGRAARATSEAWF